MPDPQCVHLGWNVVCGPQQVGRPRPRSRKPPWWSAWLIICFILRVSAGSQAFAKEVSVGLYLLDLGEFNIGTGSFTADFYLWMECASPPCFLDDFEFMNGRAAHRETIEDTPRSKFYRIQANLNSAVDLAKFPFDSQRMQVVLEDTKATVEELRYVADKSRSGVDQGSVFPGWTVRGWSAQVRDHNYPVFGETYSRYTLSVDISRLVVSSFIKTFLPVFFIVLVVLSSFVLDPDNIPMRLTMVGSALVASVMFHVSITNQLPPVGYLTLADKVMLLTYAIVLFAFITNVLLVRLNEAKRPDVIVRIHKATEYPLFGIVPVLYFLLFLFN